MASSAHTGRQRRNKNNTTSKLEKYNWNKHTVSRAGWLSSEAGGWVGWGEVGVGVGQGGNRVAKRWESFSFTLSLSLGRGNWSFNTQSEDAPPNDDALAMMAAKSIKYLLTLVALTNWLLVSCFPFVHHFFLLTVLEGGVEGETLNVNLSTISAPLTNAHTHTRTRTSERARDCSEPSLNRELSVSLTAPPTSTSYWLLLGVMSIYNWNHLSLIFALQLNCAVLPRDRSRRWRRSGRRDDDELLPSERAARKEQRSTTNRVYKS